MGSCKAVFFREEVLWIGRQSDEMRMFTAEQKELVMDMMVECRAREAERIEEFVEELSGMNLEQVRAATLKAADSFDEQHVCVENVGVTESIGSH